MRYFRLSDDIEIAGRWHLGEVTLGSGPIPDLLDTRRLPADWKLSASVTHAGRPLDFCVTSFGIPVASQELAEVIASLAKTDVQILQIAIDGADAKRNFAVPHCLRQFECLDERTSEFTKWTGGDDRPELLGQYRMVTKTRIDRRMLPSDAHFFRIAKWPVVLAVSDLMRDSMQSAGCFGAKFDEIS